jgi:hypothetical protein
VSRGANGDCSVRLLPGVLSSWPWKSSLPYVRSGGRGLVSSVDYDDGYLSTKVGQLVSFGKMFFRGVS